MIAAAQIKRGEVWLINLEPTIGDEIMKTRPCVVLTADGLGRLRLKTVVPITEAGTHTPAWHVNLKPNGKNGLTKISIADTFQVRTISVQRFKKKLGNLSAVEMEEVGAAVMISSDLQ